MQMLLTEEEVSKAVEENLTIKFGVIDGNIGDKTLTDFVNSLLEKKLHEIGGELYDDTTYFEERLS